VYNPIHIHKFFFKKITIILVYKFKLYLVLKLELTHFLNHEFLKYVMILSYYIYKSLTSATHGNKYMMSFREKTNYYFLVGVVSKIA